MTSEGGRRGAEYVYDVLVDAGVEVLVGLPGTQTLPLDRIVAEREEIRYVMARHETAIPHVAWGYFEAGGGLAATLTVPGPGDTNAMHGLKNALEDSVPMVHVSADADPSHRGKGPIHEIEPKTFDTVVKANLTVERPQELPELAARAGAIALTPPMGPVRLGVPSTILDAEFEASTASVTPERVERDSDEGYGRAVKALAAAERPLLFVGGGARRSPGGAKVVRKLADELDAPVCATLKGKGVFPEDDPRFLGVGAAHLPASSRRIVEAADVVCVLGSDLDGLSTDSWSLALGETLIHVTLDANAIDASYAADVPIVADVADAGEAILAGLRGRSDRVGGWDGAALGRAAREEYVTHLRSLGLLSDDAPANTPGVHRAIRDVIPRDAVVTTDVGGFRLWAKQTFEVYEPTGYVTAGSWAGMGVGLPAAIGAKLARPDRPVVSLMGDGSLMMCLQEFHTAVEEGIHLTVVVYDNSDYGIISKSPKLADATDGQRFAWESPDFATIAEGFGCRGVRVNTRIEARDAVAEAIDREGVDVIVVDVQTDEPSASAAADYESTFEIE